MEAEKDAIIERSFGNEVDQQNQRDLRESLRGACSWAANQRLRELGQEYEPEEQLTQIMFWELHFLKQFELREQLTRNGVERQRQKIQLGVLEKDLMYVDRYIRDIYGTRLDDREKFSTD